MPDDPLKINRTTDYNKFKFMPGNRKVNIAHVSQLKQSIQEDNLTAVKPIVINDKFQIIDGQHTFLACKDLGYSIYYIVQTGGNLSNVQSLNNSSRNWTGRDFIEMWKDRGNKNYQQLDEFMDRWRLTVGDSMRLLMNSVSGMPAGNNFKRGYFIVKDVEMAHRYAQMIYDFAPFTDSYRRRTFVIAAMKAFKQPGYKHSRMLDQLNKFSKKIPISQDWRNYLKELDRIYNLDQKVKYSLILSTGQGRGVQ